MPNAHRLLLTLCCVVMSSRAHAQTFTANVRTGFSPVSVAVKRTTPFNICSKGNAQSWCLVAAMLRCATSS
jgi:hypothetical protein